ncbi:MAG: hypothetical protein HKN68_08695 [Saprospiraceae bacterium]|nr:hypothetical protein [Saprospiraceae bacterium]
MKQLLFLIILLGIISCSSEDEVVRGCTDPDSDNYSSNATEDDGSCTYLRDIYLGNYSGTFGSCNPDENSNNFNEPKSIIIQAGEESDEVKVIVNDITVQNFREKKVMTFIAGVTNDELIFNDAPSSDRFVLGDFGYRVIFNGHMERTSSGDLSGRVTIEVYDEGSAMATVSIYSCDFTFDKN